jgi:hypothetical protein
MQPKPLPIDSPSETDENSVLQVLSRVRRLVRKKDSSKMSEHQSWNGSMHALFIRFGQWQTFNSHYWYFSVLFLSNVNLTWLAYLVSV